MDGEWMLVGRVAGSFGVHGEVKIEPLTDFPDRFASLDVLYLGEPHHAYRVERVREHNGRILAKLVGVDTPEAVRDLGQPEIFIPRAEARPLPPGHFYLEDAIGLEVATTEGKHLGTVSDVLATGSNEVFVVDGTDGQVLIPVIRDAVAELDLVARRVVVEPWVLNSD
jgi:16S rRNA processing protein RimM